MIATLATQVAELLAERDDSTTDPAIKRLLPDAYRDNADDAAEFRRFTETELADEKVRSALGMAELLTPDPESEADDKVQVRLDEAAAFDWMRSFTDIRLALAARLGIEDDESSGMLDEDSQLTMAVYQWLGGLQWSLVRAIDR